MFLISLTFFLQILVRPNKSTITHMIAPTSLPIISESTEAAFDTPMPKQADELRNILWSISTSAATFDRIIQLTSIWIDEEPDARVAIWTDKIPSDIPDKWRQITHINTASTHKWWKMTKKDHHTRIAWTIVDAFRLGVPDVDWFVISDDDTLWFPRNLANILSKYNPKEYLYIGNLSEDHGQIQFHSRMAYGGGGYVISYALAKLLSKTLANCLPRFDNLYGQDSRISSCLSELEISLTRVHGFHQLDLTGDITGLLEAMPPGPTVSLHHLQMLDQIYPHIPFMDGIQHLIRAYKAYGVDFLEQFVYTNRRNQWTFSLAPGFTLRWWERAKFVTWVRSVEITFERFMGKPHYGPHDWTFDTRRKFPRCKHYDVFHWDGPVPGSNNTHVYIRSKDPLCKSFPNVERIHVTLEKGNEDCIWNDAVLTKNATLDLCGLKTRTILQLFSNQTTKDDNFELYKYLLKNRFRHFRKKN